MADQARAPPSGNVLTSSRFSLIKWPLEFGVDSSMSASSDRPVSNLFIISFSDAGGGKGGEKNAWRPPWVRSYKQFVGVFKYSCTCPTLGVPFSSCFAYQDCTRTDRTLLLEGEEVGGFTSTRISGAPVSILFISK